MKPYRRIAPLFALALGLLPAAAHGQNLLVNADFDDDTSGWQSDAGPSSLAVEWTGEDALGDAGSGSLRLRDVVAEQHSVLFGVGQCVPVNAGNAYDVASWVKIPAGQTRQGTAYVQLIWHANAGCSSFLDFHRLSTTTASGQWHLLEAAGLVAPPGTQAARLELAVSALGAGTPFATLFDAAYLCAAGECTSLNIPDPPYAQWLTSPRLPGFSAQVRITPANGSPLQGGQEGDCIAETICVRGALAGRPELFAKVIGPRPNGYLWAQIIRFTPSQTEIWLRQDSSGTIRYYKLPAVAPTAGELPGVEDRTAFEP
jgi:hypothetical protein